ncbi:MAG TPA: shikimate kinase [Chthoniobacterales bacterium]|jgi:shikimate kinase|nr:shikimate kinase [Chthoniobacterales bacterium]
MNERGNSIVLIGFMGAGKSSAGRALARMTGLPRFDTDELITKRFGLSIPEIFAEHGEHAFRESESQTLRQLADQGPAIIVTGGGAILSSANRKLLRRLGRVVLLSADDETLFARISKRSMRPLLQTENPRATAAELMRDRLPLYREAADAEVDTTLLKHDEVARKILDLVQS